MSHVLHYAPDNAPPIIRPAQEEPGASCRSAPVDRTRKVPRDPAYPALTPAGRIPTPETPSAPDLCRAGLLRRLKNCTRAPDGWPDTSALPRLHDMCARLRTGPGRAALVAAEDLTDHPFTEPVPLDHPSKRAI